MASGKMVAKGARTATPAKKKKTAAKATAQKKKTVPSVEFSLYAPEAREVFLVGDFNNWDGTAYRMRKFKDGICKKSVKLKPGRYEYLFLVDGEWWTDPKNDLRQHNPFGTENSVLNIVES